MKTIALNQAILPYSKIVGQDKLKLALELSYIAPRIGGVLLSGQRGTGKSTAVRAFAVMVKDCLPVTLPINATEDRVVGDLDIDKLLAKNATSDWKAGLLEEAHDNGGFLYIDEVNLLDDHIVNIILDVVSTGVLSVERSGMKREAPISLNLVGTMNPEEGGLRPQLLDRFGLMVDVSAEIEHGKRLEILETVMAWDQALGDFKAGKSSTYIDDARKEDAKRKAELEDAKENLQSIVLDLDERKDCVNLTMELGAEGNRGDYIIALAAKANAALKGAQTVRKEHIEEVAELVIHHRRPEFLEDSQSKWTSNDRDKVKELLGIKKS